MSLIFKCPMCGGHTTNHIEYSNGFARNIYNCPNCNWTNRYYQIADDISTPLSSYPSKNYTNTYYTTSTSTNILTGGLQNAR